MKGKKSPTVLRSSPRPRATRYGFTVLLRFYYGFVRFPAITTSGGNRNRNRLFDCVSKSHFALQADAKVKVRRRVKKFGPKGQNSLETRDVCRSFRAFLSVNYAMRYFTEREVARRKIERLIFRKVRRLTAIIAAFGAACVSSLPPLFASEYQRRSLAADHARVCGTRVYQHSGARGRWRTERRSERACIEAARGERERACLQFHGGRGPR